MNNVDRPIPGAWGITLLVFLFMLINFADKAVLGLAATPMMAELKLTPEQFGLLGSAFYLLFPVSAVVAGFITNRRAAHPVLLVLAVLWSAVQFPMLATVTLPLLLGSRILLGLAEGPAYPVAIHAVYKWFPDSLRALPTAIVAQGASAGVIVAVPTLNWIIVDYSWHWAFGALGIAGLVWAAGWLVLGREGTLVDAPLGKAETSDHPIPYRLLLLCPTVIATCCVGFASYWGLSLVLTWFTAYMVDGLGFSQMLGGDLSVLPWLSGSVVVLAGAWLSQTLTTQGVPSRLSRGVLPCLAVLVGGCMLPFIAVAQEPWVKLGLLVGGTAIGGTIFVVVPIIISEVTPQPQRAAMLAIVNSIMTLGGVAAPVVMGSVLQNAATRLGGYDRGFLILGFLLIAGGVIGVLFIRPETDRRRLSSFIADAPTSPAKP